MIIADSFIFFRPLYFGIVPSWSQASCEIHFGCIKQEANIFFEVLGVVIRFRFSNLVYVLHFSIPFWSRLPARYKLGVSMQEANIFFRGFGGRNPIHIMQPSVCIAL